MKRNLIILTGIVFVIAILAAGGCQSAKKQNGSTDEETPKVSSPLGHDSTKIEIKLKAVNIDGSVHLEMSDSRNSGCVVIDGLITVVYPGDTVKWKKAPHSNIDKIIDIRTTDEVNIFRNGIEEIEADSTWMLAIPEDGVEPDTVKYEIEFSVIRDPKTYTIDPYLEYPDDR